MFDFGFSELLLIGLIALIVLGPKRLPEVARSAGQWIGKLRRFVENVKRDIDAEVKDEDLAAFRQMHAELNETRNLLQKSAAETFSDFSAGMDEVTRTVEPAMPAMMDAPKPAPARLPAARARRPVAKQPSQPVRKTAASRTVSKKAAGKKVATKKVANKTNRTPHGGVKKTRTR